MRIRVSHVYPPIPDRRYDWSAVDDDTYDGAPDAHGIIEYAPTREAAIEQLRDVLAEREIDNFSNTPYDPRKLSTFGWRDLLGRLLEIRDAEVFGDE